MLICIISRSDTTSKNANNFNDNTNDFNQVIIMQEPTEDDIEYSKEEPPIENTNTDNEDVYPNAGQPPDIQDVPNFSEPEQEKQEEAIDATQSYTYNALDYGLSPSNTGEENSQILQNLISSIPPDETIYIPAGEYKFAATGNQTIGSHCIKMRSNVHIVGDGQTTILKPVGQSTFGLDMFYFNELLDNNSATYLENCTFRDFVIDGVDTSVKRYTSAGKGFMFNLYRDCHWENVTVMNTDGTGFGMDCPINCTITNCSAINCGKAATTSNTGASGFGIGFGYSNDESIEIKNCSATGNKKFGFFFEHQGIFNPSLYQATDSNGFLIASCEGNNNYYNFGGIAAENVTYDSCISRHAISSGFYFESSTDYDIENCTDE